MKVFISWSGPLSCDVATVLRTYLRLAFQHMDFWMSKVDLRPGSQWSWEIGSHLTEANVGIICLTKENIGSPWILFEAGAIAHALGRNSVIPYLVDISVSDISGPLGQFQALPANVDGTQRLFLFLNESSGAPLTEGEILTTFSTSWPEISRVLGEVKKAPSQNIPKRSERNILEELLELVRHLSHVESKKASIPVFDRAWLTEEFAGRTREEIFDFFDKVLVPEAFLRARKEWEYIEAGDQQEVWAHAFELARKRARSLDLGEFWVQWLDAKKAAI